MQIRRRSPNPGVSVMYLRYEVPVPDAKPQHILEEIVWHKEVEVEQMRERTPLVELQQRVQKLSPAKDFLAALQSGKTQPAVIAEVKQASPSKGVIRADFDPVAIAQSYARGGATCLSVLTDQRFFQGSFDYLAQIRAAVDLPLLCKDFVIYAYQIYLARANGADAILLIAAILPEKDLFYFLKITRTLGMTALIEVHTLAELDLVLKLAGVTLIGINNRNLQDFSVNLATTTELLAQRRAQLQAKGVVVISESGLHTPADLHQVVEAGASAVLIGEALMKQPDPGQALQALFSAP